MSEATIAAEIEDAIKRNLPAQVGEVLKKRLVEAENDRTKLESVSRLLEDKSRECAELAKSLKKAMEELVAHERLDLRDKEITEREIRSDLKLAQVKLEASEKSKGELFDLMKVVFRNPVITETVSRYDSSNNNTSSGYENGTSNSSTTRTRTVD